MMKPEIKQKWIDALATATYKQGKEVLRNKNDEFCCLGVLCDIYSKETGVGWELSDDVSETMEIEGCISYLPIKVMNWAGLESNAPIVEIEGMGDVIQFVGNEDMIPLTWVNDRLNYTFSQIAELIREQL